MVGGQGGVGRVAALDPVHRVLVQAQPGLDGVAKGDIVFDQQDAHAGFPATRIRQYGVNSSPPSMPREGEANLKPSSATLVYGPPRPRSCRWPPGIPDC